MDSSGHHHHHLDATTDREVVYCHACSHEWYREEGGILCPDCGSDITEIISPDNDPRFDSTPSSPDEPSFRVPPVQFDDDDSDPDEADIAEHIGPDGWTNRRTTRDESRGQRRQDPDLGPALERFFGMIQGFGQTPQPTTRRERRFGEPHVHSTIFTTGNTTSLTFVSGPATHNFTGGGGGGGDDDAGPPGSGRPVDPFQTFFMNIMREVALPENDEAGPPGGAGGPEGSRGPGGPSPTFPRGLAEIIHMFSPANAVAGDAVYSQEALDRIITNLMEAHPQSNAAPPASAESLANLERRPVDASLLADEEKTDCTICIDDMKIGEMAAFLPCKHWFHESCVVLWLKEHNTCPVCRASIEKESNPNDDISPSSPSYNTRRSGLSDRNEGTTNNPYFSQAHRPAHLSRPPSQSQTRLNEVLRNMTSSAAERERERTRERERERDGNEPFGFSFDTSRLQRRTSLSPSSPRQSMPGDYRRMRERSPSQSSSRLENRNSEQSGRSSGSGPLSWFRDTFSGRGSSNSNHDPNRDRR